MAATLTRRELSLLMAGGLAVAGCSGASTSRSPGPLRDRPERTRPLPPAETATSATLTHALLNRHSVRSFAAEQVTDQQAAQLLWAAQGQTRSWGGRTAPSAGALYPLDLYALTADRLWHYVPATHTAQEWRIAADLRPALRRTSYDQPAVTAAPLIVVVTATPSRTAGKYGSRATRYVALEAGHSAQNLVLQATALGLGAVTVGAFNDADVADILGLRRGEVPHYLIPVGHPATSA